MSRKKYNSLSTFTFTLDAMANSIPFLRLFRISLFLLEPLLNSSANTAFLREPGDGDDETRLSMTRTFSLGFAASHAYYYYSSSLSVFLVEYVCMYAFGTIFM